MEFSHPPLQTASLPTTRCNRVATKSWQDKRRDESFDKNGTPWPQQFHLNEDALLAKGSLLHTSVSAFAETLPERRKPVAYFTADLELAHSEKSEGAFLSWEAKAPGAFLIQDTKRLRMIRKMRSGCGRKKPPPKSAP